MYRRNSDSRLRQLERQYQTGQLDPDVYINALKRAVGSPLSEPHDTGNLEFLKVLVLSTSHITQEDTTAIEQITYDNYAPAWTIIPHLEYGWWIRIPYSPAERDPTTWARDRWGVPPSAQVPANHNFAEWEEASRVFSSTVFNLLMFAHGHGCQWLRLDSDGSTIEELPTFDW